MRSETTIAKTKFNQNHKDLKMPYLNANSGPVVQLFGKKQTLFMLLHVTVILLKI